jgi:hypothetical protein
MCTTSTECETIITAMLMVMSGMDPHMISSAWDGCSVMSLVCLPGCGSITVRLHGATEIVSLRR